jgi:hypothetical protein
MSVFPLLIIIVIGSVIFFAYQSHQRSVATWQRVANQLGLDIVVGSGFSKPLITGNLHGMPVRIDTYTQRQGNSSTTYTRYQVRYPSSGFDFELKREGTFSFIGKIFGVQDVEIGDPVFDGAFKIKTSDRNRLVALLTPSVRNGLFRLLASHPSAVVSEDHIGMTRQKFESDGDRLSSSIQRLVATAQLLISPSAGVSDHNVTDREQGLLTEVVDRVRQAIEEHPEDIDQRIFEVETLAAAGEDEQAAERVVELEQLAPADPDVAGWKEALSTPTASQPAEGLDVDEMSKDLFGSDDLSFETRSKFNSKYAGANVTWEGRVKQTRQSGPTATVTVTVATVGNDLYGNTEIDVLVDTPADRAPEVDSRVTVSGMLSTIDPLMRNIYLANATVD